MYTVGEVPSSTLFAKIIFESARGPHPPQGLDQPVAINR